MKLNFVVSNNCSNSKTENGVNNGQHKFQTNNIRYMFCQQKVMLRNIPVVIIGNSNIEQNIQYHRKIEKRKIQTVTLIAHQILHSSVYSKNPKRLNQDIQEKK